MIRSKARGRAARLACCCAWHRRRVRTGPRLPIPREWRLRRLSAHRSEGGCRILRRTVAGTPRLCPRGCAWARMSTSSTWAAGTGTAVVSASRRHRPRRAQVVLSGLNLPNGLAPGRTAASCRLSGKVSVSIQGRPIRQQRPRCGDGLLEASAILCRPWCRPPTVPFHHVGSAHDHCERADGSAPIPPLHVRNRRTPRAQHPALMRAAARSCADRQPYAVGLRNSMALRYCLRAVCSWPQFPAITSTAPIRAVRRGSAA